MPEIRLISAIPKQMAVATLAQAAPVQNTWYTVLDTTLNSRLLYITIQIEDTGEDLEAKLTIDGQTYTSYGGPQASVAGTIYNIWLNLYLTAGLVHNAGIVNTLISSPLEGRSIKFEVRKTTATGVGKLNSSILYQKW